MDRYSARTQYSTGRFTQLEAQIIRGDTNVATVLTTLPILPYDGAFALTNDYVKDSHPLKVSLGAGLYRDESSKPWILPSVRKAKELLHNQLNLDHEYLPIAGSTPYLQIASDLLFGENASSEKNSCSIQTISGTGANHLGALFLAQHLHPKNVFISDPTWNNHHLIWEAAAPNVDRKTYPYYRATDRSFDIEGMLSTLETEAVEDDDFATGEPDRDAWAVRYFHRSLLKAREGGLIGLCVAQSFAKSFGLYGERAGAFHLVLPSESSSEGAQSQLLRLVRAEISNPPLFGARIVRTILESPELSAQWKMDLKTMSGRILRMRHLLREKIEAHPGVGDWSHLESQIGMFSYTGLSAQQAARLREKHHVYLMANGRASLSGVSPTNVSYVADAFVEVVAWVRAADSQ